MKYKSILLPKKGPPSVLQLIESELREPTPNEVRIKIICTGVGFTDIIMRYGYYPYAPKMPFVPGYELVGTVDAIGAGVTKVSVGQRVAALTVHGGYSEYTYLPPDNLVPVLDGVDPAEALSLVLNYVTAYQMLHREAKVQAGDSIFITGAAGGVGTALLQLGKVAGLTMYGTASKAKHQTITDLGGIPIDYKNEDFVAVVKQKTNGKGVKAAFDAIGGSSARRCYKIVQKGGKLVSFGVTGTIKDGKADNLSGLVSFVIPTLLNLIPDGKKAVFYGITQLYRKNPQPFKEDLAKLFELLKAGQIKPLIAQKFPLLEAVKANEMLETGTVNGKLILVA